MVDEGGPELFVPNIAGSIVPNHAMGGDMIDNYISIPITAPPGTVGRPTLDQIPSAALAGAQRAQRRKRCIIDEKFPRRERHVAHADDDHDPQGEIGPITSRVWTDCPKCQGKCRGREHLPE